VWVSLNAPLSPLPHRLGRSDDFVLKHIFLYCLGCFSSQLLLILIISVNLIVIDHREGRFRHLLSLAPCRQLKGEIRNVDYRK
jgi:hypothetical protein